MSPGPDDALGIYRRPLRYAAPHWAMFSVGVVGMALFAASDASLAWLTTEVPGRGIRQTESEDPDPRAHRCVHAVPDPRHWRLCFELLPGWVGRQVIKSLRGELFSHYLHLPSLYFDGQQSGQMLSRLTYNIELVAEASTNAITVIIRDTLTICRPGRISALLNWRLALFTFIAAPLIAWLIRVANRAFRRYSGRIQNSMGEVTRVAKEAIDWPAPDQGLQCAGFRGARSSRRSHERHRHNNMRLIMAKSISNPVVQQIAWLWHLPVSCSSRSGRCWVAACASINSSAFSPRCCCSPRRCVAW